LLSALLRYAILLTDPLFNMIYRFSERYGLHIRVLLPGWKTQHPTNSGSLQERGLQEHRGDARQDVHVEALEMVKMT
jgi:hypothetical protein